MIFEIQFFGTIFLVLIAVGYYAIIIQNKLFKTYFEQFLKQTKHLESNVIKDLRMGQISRHVSGFGKEYLYLGDTADIYLYDNFIVFFRRQSFVIDVNYKPIIITYDTNNLRKQYSFGDIYEPKKVLFRTTVKGEVIITLTNIKYKNSDTIITLKKLNSEQIEQLTKIKEWVEK